MLQLKHLLFDKINHHKKPHKKSLCVKLLGTVDWFSSLSLTKTSQSALQKLTIQQIISRHKS